MSRALVALDLDQEPEALLDAAVSLLQRLEVRADLVWVDRHDATSGFGRYGSLSLQLIQAHEALHQQQAARLQALLTRLPEGLRGEALALDGDPASAVAAIADRYDLLVLGSHGRTGLMRLILGSVAESILRAVHLPTLLVRPQRALHDRPSALIALDLSDRSAGVLQAARPWLQAIGADVDLLHVDDTMVYATDVVEALPHRLPTLELQERDAQLRQQLMALGADLPGFRDAYVLRGPAAVSIADLGEGYDLVVLGTHGRSGLQRVWFGSVTEHALRHLGGNALIVHVGAG